MTIRNTPWDHPIPKRSQIHLDVVPSGVLHALAAGESASLPLRYVSPFLAGPDALGLWRMRSEQVNNTPTDAPWVTRLIIDPEITPPVGVAGFHGAPDYRGMIEVGYLVDPGFRRRGYARKSLEILLDVASRQPDVRVVRATISPGNIASKTLIDDFGFIEVGVQWDDEDGLEIIYEVDALGNRS
ncbi:GNAT family N-acetyltransferase [Arthrobacter sp. Rue61a]|uniref:GNAT family N-acetyltransferase n=1 Tax=Arthrobacter sp. Rue61a TaxID=1118963 RepID=UPI00027DF3E2|nr:GNAT family N-acetyltransferase [Arthrobacter sp. Rue61a]AFR31338.1 hypothetical protein ARUE_232p01300 [Arthrobacter sp. Rue61a]